MARVDKQNLKVRILKLATLKSTGPPSELAVRFDISERSIKRIVREIREEGNTIRYCPLRRSYVTEEKYQ
jgi:biotin operon repressor